jgi:hypothetical protein
MVLSLAEARKVTPLHRRALIIPAEIPDVAIAEVLDVTSSTVGNWRAGRCWPQRRYRPRVRKLGRLIDVIRVAEMQRLRREMAATRAPTLTVHTG